MRYTIFQLEKLEGAKRVSTYQCSVVFRILISRDTTSIELIAILMTKNLLAGNCIIWIIPFSV
jgi:hypothetical protein